MTIATSLKRMKLKTRHIKTIRKPKAKASKKKRTARKGYFKPWAW